MSGRITVFCLGNYRMACEVTREEGDAIIEAIRKGEPVRITGKDNTSIIVMPGHVISAEYKDKPAVVPTKLTDEERAEYDRQDKLPFPGDGG
jgi:hypothetical protein